MLTPKKDYDNYQKRELFDSEMRTRLNIQTCASCKNWHLLKGFLEIGTCKIIKQETTCYHNCRSYAGDWKR